VREFVCQHDIFDDGDLVFGGGRFRVTDSLTYCSIALMTLIWIWSITLSLMPMGIVVIWMPVLMTINVQQRDADGDRAGYVCDV
jgi:hypothetical protein